jgi:putative Ca2+/H+ antiporter (TMEM165/GDT1 family)
LLASFCLIFLSELGDKTFFIAALLAMKLGRWISFVGSVGALAVMTLISVGIGAAFSRVPESLQSSLPVGEIAGVALLVFFGIKALRVSQARQRNSWMWGVGCGVCSRVRALCACSWWARGTSAAASGHVLGLRWQMCWACDYVTRQRKGQQARYSIAALAFLPAQGHCSMGLCAALASPGGSNMQWAAAAKLSPAPLPTRPPCVSSCVSLHRRMQLHPVSCSTQTHRPCTPPHQGNRRAIAGLLLLKQRSGSLASHA